jgi:hypothetical protein
MLFGVHRGCRLRCSYPCTGRYRRSQEMPRQPVAACIVSNPSPISDFPKKSLDPEGVVVSRSYSHFRKMHPFKANLRMRRSRPRFSETSRDTRFWFASAPHPRWSLRVRKSDRQNELESRPILAIRRRRKLAVVTLDNHAANGKSQSHSVWLCRDEWIKYTFQSSRIDSRSGIFHCDDNCVGTVILRFHLEHPTSIHSVIH